MCRAHEIHARGICQGDSPRRVVLENDVSISFPPLFSLFFFSFPFGFYTFNGFPTTGAGRLGRRIVVELVPFRSCKFSTGKLICEKSFL